VDYDRRFVRQMVCRVLAAVGTSCIPVDLCSIAQYQGVHAVRLAPILPHGIMAPDTIGFTIHLKSRHEHVIDLPAASGPQRPPVNLRLSARQRFTLAHEIVHTFFYRWESGSPELMTGAPNGHKLEALCQFGAGLLTVPDHLLYAHVREDWRLSSASQVVRLCGEFGVSPEVLLRRIGEDQSLIEMGSAVVLAKTDPHADVSAILAGCCHLSLTRYLPAPRRFTDLQKWLGAHAGRHFSFERKEEWQRSVSRCECLRFLVTPWRKRAGTFFVEVQLVPLQIDDNA